MRILHQLRYYLFGLPRKHAIILMSIAVGIASGLVAVILKNAVFAIQFVLTDNFAISAINWGYALYPAVGIALTYLIIRRVLKGNHPGPGIPSTLHAISKRKGQLKRKQMFASVITSVFTVGFGGSAGLEAPAVQSTASIGSNLASAFKMNYKTRILLIGCAAAGSLAAIFKAPIAAIIFAVEVIMIDLTTASLVPLLMASLSALLTTYLFLDSDQLLRLEEATPFEFKHIALYVFLGIGCGVFSVYFNKIYLFITSRIQRLKKPMTRILIGGLLLGVLTLFFPALYGEGYDVINAFLRDDIRESTLNSMFYEVATDSWVILAYLLGLVVLKAIATGITLGSGGVGGIFAPTLFMGGTFGYLFGKLADRSLWFDSLPVGNFALVGMAGLMAGVLHAPLTSIFLIAEISGGYGLFVPLMISAGIAYYTSKLFNKHTIYTQELAERGELITHNKDQAVLTLMSLQDEIEDNFTPIEPDWTLRQMVKSVSISKRNLFPVLDHQKRLIGVVSLDDIRPIMFDTELYDEMTVESMMSVPPEMIYLSDRMEEVVKKFDESGAWNLPVIDGKGQYIGFVSKSRLFTVYRQVLMDVSNA
ncbi:MAG: chloride channel protein [Flavobacteriales bacterium]|nr:chloride channel protein [Flavobacteriales bacterium]MDG1781768.1 chloride channel protein [Flavobacteriales bacterium]MDG2246008.1 chloride channel protein [Flavobacteriales bacterium]